MLKSFDILIGFCMVMLITSMAVTVLTQIWTATFNTRGTHLRQGLAQLLHQLHCALSPAVANSIADYVLQHPLIRDGGRLGSLIHRDELVRLLLEAASANSLPDAARNALFDALSRGGVPDPQGTLQKIREHALALEVSSPVLTEAVRHDLAILQTTSSEFVAKINGWFDRTMDRVSARFTMTTRRITLVNSVLIAVIVQLDAVSIVNRLSTSDSLRSTLIEKAYAEDKLSAMDAHQLTALASHDIFPMHPSFQAWLAAWHLSSVPGILLSILLLSLGAPFWFEALKGTLKLRKIIRKN